MQESRGCPDVDDSSDEPPPIEADGGPSHATVTETAGRGDEAPDWLPQGEWHDWRWQMRNRIRTLQQLHQRFPSLPLSQGMADAAVKFPLAITPYYASLMDRDDPQCPVRRQVVPRLAETRRAPRELI